MECDAMEVSFVLSVPGTMEESIPNDSEPSTSKSVASPAFSLISSDDLKTVRMFWTTIKSRPSQIVRVMMMFSPTNSMVYSYRLSRNECSIVAGKDSTTLETDKAVRGTKIVIDNVDKNVVPRLMTSEKQTQSLHYVHVFAVEDIS